MSSRASSRVCAGVLWRDFDDVRIAVSVFCSSARRLRRSVSSARAFLRMRVLHLRSWRGLEGGDRWANREGAYLDGRVGLPEQGFDCFHGGGGVGGEGAGAEVRWSARVRPGEAVGEVRGWPR